MTALSRQSFLAAAMGGIASLAVSRPARGATPVRLLMMGDSVSWGQGLVPSTGEKIQELLVQRWSPAYDVSVTSVAHSGAIIGFDSNLKPIAGNAKPWDPEVPQPYPTLLDQLQHIKATMPAGGYDVVFLTGGINDVNVEYIFNPLTSTQGIQARVNTYIYGGLAAFLAQAVPLFIAANPNVVIAVGCYYAMASKASHFPSTASIAASLLRDARSPNGSVPKVSDIHAIALFPSMVKNAEAFTLASHVAIAAVVQEANASAPLDANGDRRDIVFFVDPKIDDAHAAMTDTPDLWGLDAKADPQDPYQTQRKALCRAAGLTGLSGYTCVRASVGHPNLQGAAAYATAIDGTIGDVLRARIAARAQASPAS